MAGILLIEDSRRLRASLQKGLSRAGYAVDLAADGEEGLFMALHGEHDVIILDLMLPRLDGISLLERLRAEGHDTHVLILTARDRVEDRVDGLTKGADDYLVKPFALEELLARVQALTRRAHGIKSPKVRVGTLDIDLARKTASRDSEIIDLTSREFALLEYLALRKGEVVSRPQIEAHLYADEVDLMSNVVDSFVYRLRKKIQASHEPSLIRTRRGLGYVLDDPE